MLDVWDNDGGKPEFKPEYPKKLMKDLPVSAKRGPSTITDKATLCGESLVTFSKSQVALASSKHNKHVRKMRRKNWSIPVVYHGMSTIN